MSGDPPLPDHERNQQRVTVLTLGSPHGDDRVGWEIGRRLLGVAESAPTSNVQIHLISSPWDLVHRLENEDCLILVDACQSGAAPGTVHRLARADLAAVAFANGSTHGGTLDEALRLAAQLGRRPRSVAVFAVEIGTASPAAGLSQSVADGITEATTQIQALAQQWARSLESH